MNREPLAILFEPVDFNVSSAQQYGRLVTLFDADRGSYRPPIWKPDQFEAFLLKRLDEIGYDPEIDYIVISGSTANLIVLSSVVAAAYGVIKILLYNGKYSKNLAGYEALTIGHVDHSCEPATA